MSVLKYFKNIPRSPPIGRQALSVIFFLQIRNEVPGEKKGGLSPTPGATGACRPLGGGDRVPFIRPGRHMPPFPLSFESKNSGKKLECLPCCYIFLKWWKSTTIGSRMSGQRMRHLGNPWSPCWVVATCDLVLAARYTMVPILSYSSV